MRALFGCLAVLLCVVSVALAARYGYKGADTEIDGVISAVVFGLIALCACLFDAAAVRLWFMGHRIGAAVIGGHRRRGAGRDVHQQPGRHRRPRGQHPGRARPNQGRRGGQSRRAGEDHAGARRPRIHAHNRRCREGGARRRRHGGTHQACRVRQRDQRQRGPNCRQRETEEQAKRDSLASVLTNKALTERAAQLDADAARVGPSSPRRQRCRTRTRWVPCSSR